MDKHGIIRVPIQTHLKKFITKQYGTPFKIDLSSVLGQMVSLHISGKSSVKKRIIGCNDYMEVTISNRHATRGEVRISYISMLAYATDRLFKEQMYIFVKAQEMSGFSKWQAATNFLKYFDIREDEYNIDSLYRALERKEVSTIVNEKKLSKAS